MGESSQSSDDRCLEDLELLILEVEVPLEQLIHREVRGVCGDAARSYHLGALPKAKEAFLSV